MNYFLFVIRNPKHTTRRNKGQQEKDANDAVIKASYSRESLLQQRKVESTLEYCTVEKKMNLIMK